MDIQQMKFRKGSINDFDNLNWFWTENHQKTKEKFIFRINKGMQELWVVEYRECLIGELHIVWNSVDKDEADGLKRAYIFSYRVKPNFQGKSVGSKLMNKVLDRIREKNFTEATVGVETNEVHLKKMYNNWGFNDFIKTKDIDHHGFTSKGQYKSVPSYDLFLNKLW
ncbi:hypothetical protein J14TS2_23740 [Bacillus sp. J14TS2]|uniref:GNAT family N-acetyltransferase n=1 Tax=Bacillus sp. J14TS2 TaxID=2807188 RepID=UPI001B0F5752|nr:GNAT family N-acetyltransferase [Bacillus sp. J14TS2]GIN71899.1 hypothetical protein J14TS2_23740 [Bacillus sp. J14TS2]